MAPLISPIRALSRALLGGGTSSSRGGGVRLGMVSTLVTLHGTAGQKPGPV